MNEFENLENIINVLGNSNIKSQSLKILIHLSESPKTITKISEDLGLHMATVKKYCKEMEEIGLLKSEKIDSGKKGRSPTQYKLVRARIKIGCDGFNITVRKNYLKGLQKYLN
jgi:predicted ArsR family transcriptional regulator